MIHRLNRCVGKASLVVALAMFCQLAVAALPDFTELVENNHKSVVNISTTSGKPAASTGNDGIPQLDDSPFGEFFRKFLEEQSPGFRDLQFDSDSLGSGFIVSEDGYVLTNNHVVDGADEIVVRLHDRRQFVAELVGKDARSDVAVLKIDAAGLPAAKIGKSSELKVGEQSLIHI